ncbi:virion structural protein [Pseudomonas phage PhiPA3]|uniref:Virion structural protein n=1 Tax=Pseudomonas phage PhiPA3 TaxID=998086 RepID=F8SJJ4_BPPA3|nr:virion structural protein [Pseudomonas phage PhiPA3]AEH03785.1 virion structural protein [Pseudomonas phage PhiPA3]
MIQFEFKNPNPPDRTVINIFRTPVDTPIPEDPTDSPIAVLDGFANSFRDVTAVGGSTYNYRIQTVFNNTKAISPQFTMKASGLYGPGSELRSSMSQHVFGKVIGVTQDPQLPTADELITALNIPGLVIGNWTNKWTKLNDLNGDYYYTALGGYLQILPENLYDVLTELSSGKLITINDFTYAFDMSNTAEYIMNSYCDSDAEYLENIEHEVRGKSIVEAAAGFLNVAEDTIVVANRISSYVTQKLYSRAGLTKFYPDNFITAPDVNTSLYKIYWKVALRLIGNGG